MAGMEARQEPPRAGRSRGPLSLACSEDAIERDGRYSAASLSNCTSPSGSSCPPGPSLGVAPSELSEAEDAVAALVSGEVWSPDWMVSVSGAVASCATRFGAWGAADAVAEPPRARASAAAVMPLNVFNRLRMRWCSFVLGLRQPRS